MALQVKLLALILVCFLFYIVETRTCKKKSSCSCKSDQGIMNLKGLSTKGILFQHVQAQDVYTYFYNPCKDFSLTEDGANIEECGKVAICQRAQDNGFVQLYSLGSQSTASFDFVPGDSVMMPDMEEVLTLSYVSDQDVSRTGRVSLVCDETEHGVFTAFGEIMGSQPPTYSFTLRSKYACFKPAGISPGSVLLIIFFTTAMTYLIVGALFNKVYRHHQGKQIIPQSMFWTVTLPGLVKDGFYFVFKRGHYQPVRTS